MAVTLAAGRLGAILANVVFGYFITVSCAIPILSGDLHKINCINGIIYSGDLNCGLVRYSGHEDLSDSHQMVHNSDHLV